MVDFASNKNHMPARPGCTNRQKGLRNFAQYCQTNRAQRIKFLTISKLKRVLVKIVIQDCVGWVVDVLYIYSTPPAQSNMQCSSVSWFVIKNLKQLMLDNLEVQQHFLRFVVANENNGRVCYSIFLLRNRKHAWRTN